MSVWVSGTDTVWVSLYSARTCASACRRMVLFLAFATAPLTSRSPFLTVSPSSRARWPSYTCMLTIWPPREATTLHGSLLSTTASPSCRSLTSTCATVPTRLMAAQPICSYCCRSRIAICRTSSESFQLPRRSPISSSDCKMASSLTARLPLTSISQTNCSDKIKSAAQITAPTTSPVRFFHLRSKKGSPFRPMTRTRA